MSEDIKPFPFPFGYWLNPFNKLGDQSIKDYIEIFERHRQERAGGVFAQADIGEIFRLAEDMGGVEGKEVDCIRDLIQQHPDFFADDAQRQELIVFAANHELLNTARQDDIANDLCGLPPLTFFRYANGGAFVRTALELSATLKASDAYNAEHGNYDPALVARVNVLAGGIRTLVDGLTLSDIDDSGKEARQVFFRDIQNLLLRTSGQHTDHESKWDGRKWMNWNRDVAVYPTSYEKPVNLAELTALARQDGPVRMVGGGHAFNNSSSMGGHENAPLGKLVTLDEYRLDDREIWKRIDAGEAAARYKLSADSSQRVVHAAAGVRLRDFGKWMWNNGMALPVAGSTDAQSLAGLIATDLHSTGKHAGFLSSQLLEVVVISGRGSVVRFIKDESVLPGTPGRWRFTPPDQTTPHLLSYLPVAGALGMLGIVAEVVLKLDAAYNMRKTERFVPASWAEANIERLLDPSETEPRFRNDHVSFYYTGGSGPIRTIRMNTWQRTTDPLSSGGLDAKKVREIFDMVGTGFLPDFLVKIAQRPAPIPGEPVLADADFWIKTLNGRESMILPANEAFARKLFFQHDEIEVGLPLPKGANGGVDCGVFRRAIAATQALLNEEEFCTIVEVRFTPDLSEAMLGPGTHGATCYIELATAFGDYSKARIFEVYDKFERLMQRDFAAKPHLGKKTSFTCADLAATYGPFWDEFQAIRRVMDPDLRYLPRENTFLTRLFGT